MLSLLKRWVYNGGGRGIVGGNDMLALCIISFVGFAKVALTCMFDKNLREYFVLRALDVRLRKILWGFGSAARLKCTRFSFLSYKCGSSTFSLKSSRTRRTLSVAFMSYRYWSSCVTIELLYFEKSEFFVVSMSFFLSWVLLLARTSAFQDDYVLFKSELILGLLSIGKFTPSGETIIYPLAVMLFTAGSNMLCSCVCSSFWDSWSKDICSGASSFSLLSSFWELS